MEKRDFYVHVCVATRPSGLFFSDITATQTNKLTLEDTVLLVGKASNLLTWICRASVHTE